MRRMGVLCFGVAVTLTLILLSAASAIAQDKKPSGKESLNRSACKVKFSVVAEDTLKNLTQGLSDKDAKWFEKKIEKKYPDVCYVPPAQDVPLVFLVTVAPDVYHGTRVYTSENPVSGTATDQDGNTSQINGTATSSTAVPYSFKYRIFTLAIEKAQPDGKWKVLHRFQQDGIYNTLYGIPLGGKGHHPLHTVLEEAAKWIHGGGLTNPLESVAPE